jgi:zinc protease
MTHPYARPVIGWEAEISTMNRAQAMDFYQHHYAPNNAMLMVVGDVNPEDVRKVAEEKFGSIAPHTLVPRIDDPAPPRLAESRMNFAIPGTQLPQLMRMYRVPGYVKSPKGTAESLEVLNAILGGGATSRLYRTLVLEKKLAIEAGAFYDGKTRGPAELTVFAVPRDGVSFDALEAGMDQVIAGLAANPPDQAEFTRVKTKLLADHIYQQDNQFVLANEYGTALSIGLTIADVEDWPNRIKAVQPADVKKAASSYLLKEQSVTGRLSASKG